MESIRYRVVDAEGNRRDDATMTSHMADRRRDAGWILTPVVDEPVSSSEWSARFTRQTAKQKV
jgi:hypothetical protein